MQISTNPAELFDSIERFNVEFEKAYGRMGPGRPTGLTVLGQAATDYVLVRQARGKDGKGNLSDPSPAEIILTGDDLTDVPAECIATLGSGKSAKKFTTYALIGTHVATSLGFAVKTIESLGKLPGTSAATIQKLLLELPSMAEHRAEVEERRKAQAKASADKAKVREVVEHAQRFGVVPEEKHFADIIKARDLTWPQIQALMAEVQGEPAESDQQ